MPGNHLEDLVAEWYQLNGYFVRRNIQVGKRPQGGYECELDVVAFHPLEKKLVHIEPSLDTDSWDNREQRYLKKFRAGKLYIPTLFDGLSIPTEIDQIALLFFGGGKRTTLAQGRVLLVKDFMKQILEYVRKRSVNTAAISQQYPLLRTLQFAAAYWPSKMSS